MTGQVAAQGAKGEHVSPAGAPEAAAGAKLAAKKPSNNVSQQPEAAAPAPAGAGMTAWLAKDEEEEAANLDALMQETEKNAHFTNERINVSQLDRFVYSNINEVQIQHMSLNFAVDFDNK